MEKRGLGLIICVSGSCIAILIILVLVAFYISNGVRFSPGEEIETYKKCINNTCTIIPGVGIDECSPEGSFCGCMDTDTEEKYPSGMNFFMQGTARNSTLSKTDRCSFEGNLVEYTCKGSGEVISFEVSCESLGNYTCISGECFPDNREMEECADSDGGLNYPVDGYATNGKIRITDYCTDEGKLAEVYCSPASEEVLIEIFDCSKMGNYQCEHGKCIR